MNFENPQAPAEACFVGRQDLCHQLFKQVGVGGTVALVGFSGTGKSSVLCRLRREVVDQGKIFVRMDLAEFGGDAGEIAIWQNMVLTVYNSVLDRPVACWRRILLALPGVKSPQKSMRKIVSQSRQVETEHAAEECAKQMVKVLSEHRIRVVLVIDRFCSSLKLKPRADDFMDRFVGFVKSLRDYAKDTIVPLTIVLVSKRTLDMIQDKTGASYLKGCCTTYALRPFSEAEVGELCAHSTRKISPAMARRIFYFSGGHPYLVTLLLHHLNSGADTVENAYSAAKGEFVSYYDDIRRVLKEFPYVGAESPNINDWFDALLWRELYDVVLPGRIYNSFTELGLYGKDQRLRSDQRFFRQYLLSQKCTGPLLLELMRIEKDLRSFVDKKLTEYYGSDEWIDLLKVDENENWERDSTGRIRVKDIPGTLKRWRQEEIAKYPDGSPNILEYAYPNDLYGLMFYMKRHWLNGVKTEPSLVAGQRWIGFSEYFQDEHMFCSAMSAFCDIRNREHHGRICPQEIAGRWNGCWAYLREKLSVAMHEVGLQ